MYNQETRATEAARPGQSARRDLMLIAAAGIAALAIALPVSAAIADGGGSSSDPASGQTQGIQVQDGNAAPEGAPPEGAPPEGAAPPQGAPDHPCPEGGGSGQEGDSSGATMSGESLTLY
jgi:hypothetical protein